MSSQSGPFHRRRSLSKNLRLQVFRRDRFTCQYCGRQSPEVTIEVDHIIPFVLGGTDKLSNLQTACRDCNGSKSDKVDVVRHRWGPTQYEQMIAALLREERAYWRAALELAEEAHTRFASPWTIPPTPEIVTVFPTLAGLVELAVARCSRATVLELVGRLTVSAAGAAPDRSRDVPVKAIAVAVGDEISIGVFEAMQQHLTLDEQREAARRLADSIFVPSWGLS